MPPERTGEIYILKALGSPRSLPCGTSSLLPGNPCRAEPPLYSPHGAAGPGCSV